MTVSANGNIDPSPPKQPSRGILSSVQNYFETNTSCLFGKAELRIVSDAFALYPKQSIYLFPILSACNTICMQNYLYAILSICNTICFQHYLHAILYACKTICMQYYLYAILSVYNTFCVQYYLYGILSICNTICKQYYLHAILFVSNTTWWCGRVVKAQCFQSCEVYSRGFESRRWHHYPQAKSQLSCPSFRGRQLSTQK